MSTTFLVEQRGDPYRALTYLLFSFTISYIIFQRVPTPDDPVFLGTQFIPSVIIITGVLSVLFATVRLFERLYIVFGSRSLRRHMVEVEVRDPTSRRHQKYDHIIPPKHKLLRKQWTPTLAQFILCYKKEKRRFYRTHISANLAHYKENGEEGLVEPGRWVPIKFALLSPYISKQRNKVIGLWYFCISLLLFIVSNPLFVQIWVLLILIVIEITAFLASVFWFKDSWVLWAFALHLSLFQVKWHEVSKRYSNTVKVDTMETTEPKYEFPAAFFRDLQRALRDGDRVFAESIIFELDRRYAEICRIIDVEKV